MLVSLYFFAVSAIALLLLNGSKKIDEPNISADCNTFHSQAGASNAVDNNNNTDDEGSF